MAAANFVDFRASIEKDVVCAWLKDIGPNADQLVQDTLAKAKLLPNPYDGKLVEQLLRETAEALDRCLAFRREADDLEVLAVRQALDDKLFTDSQPFEEAIDELTHPVNEPQSEEAGYQTAAVAFGVAKGELLAPGLSKACLGMAEAAKARGTNAISLRAQLLQKRKLSQDYQSQLQSFHVMPGSGLYFADRRQRVLTLLTDDLTTIALKVIALEQGLNSVYGVDLSAESLGTLEDYVIWCRAAINGLAPVLQRSSEVFIVLSILNPLPGGTIYTEGSAIFDQTKVQANPVFNFRILPQHLPINGAKVRLRGMGVSYGIGNGAFSDPAHQPNPNEASEFSGYAEKLTGLGAHSKIPFGSIRLFKAFGGADLTSSSAVQNIDPVGDWSLTMNAAGSFVDSQPVSVASFANILLHFRCVIVP